MTMNAAKMSETSNDGLDEAVFQAAEGIVDNYEFVGVAVMETPEEDAETVIYATNSWDSTPDGFIRLPGMDAETLVALHTTCGLRVFVEPVNNPQSVQKFILNAAEDVWRALPDYMEYGSLRVDRNGGGEMYPFDPVRKIASGPLAISTDALPRFHAELDRFGLWSGWKRSSECSDMWLQRLPRQSAFVGKRELRHVPGFEGKYGCIIRLDGRKGH